MFGVFAIATASLFTGAAAYINWAEHPARMSLNDAAMLAEWKPSYARGFTMQASLAIIAGILGLLEALVTGSVLWALGAILILANWPYTLVSIMPVNKALEAIRIEDAGPHARDLMIRWNKLHSGRTALGALSIILYILAQVA